MEKNAVINLLGLKAKDKVTGMAGVITSVSFDLYGCVQVVVTPPMSKEGKSEPGYWYDVNRVKLLGSTHVMPVPDFSLALTSPDEYSKGPAEKPVR